MRKRYAHKALSVFLAVLMIFSSVNMTVYAADLQKEIVLQKEDNKVTYVDGVQEAIYNAATSDKKGTCGENLSWTLTDDGILTIAGEGAMDDCAAGEYLDFHNYADAIKSIVIKDGVTYIGSHAFESLPELVRVSMADSVTEIGEYAFANCDSLHSVKNSSNLETLGDGVFYGCTFISYSFPSSIKKVGKGLFENAGKYCHIQWPRILPVIPERTLVGFGGVLGSVRIQYGVTTVGKSAFENSEVENIELPESVVEIQEKAFDSSELKEIVITNEDCDIYDSESTIGTNVVIRGKSDSTAQEYAEKYGRSFEILEEFETSGKCGDDLNWEIIKTSDGYTLNISGTGAMYSWNGYSDAPWYSCVSSITQINIAEGITSIGDYAFVDSISLSEINLPNTITNIGRNAFYSSGLVEVEIPESVISIDSDCFRHCYQLERVILHEGLESIYADAFCLCISLKQVPDFPESLTYLGREAFIYCSSMSGTLRLPTNITNIYTNTFYNCYGLSGTVTIPTKVESIRDDAFANCTGIDKIIIYDNVESFLYDPFSNSGVVLCCYEGSYVDEWARENLYKVEYLETYTVSFDSNGGSSISDITDIHLGEKIKKPTDPTKANYTFVNWYTSNLVQDEATLWDFSKPISENITLYAKWRGRSVSVSFDAQGGSVSPSGITVYYGEAYGILPDASRSGYTFDGWYTECDGGDLVCGEDICMISSETLYLYAHWVPNTYIISFDSRGGNQGIESKEVVFGQKYNQLPTPSREGYEFLGWSLSNESQEFVNETTTVNIVKDTTLYAFWKAITYNLSLDARGGKVDTASLKVSYGERYPSLPIPKKDGCEFQGWFDAPQNGNQITENDVVNIANDHTLYAYWVGDERTVVLHPCGGVLSNNTVIQSYGAQYNLPTPEREGYIFLGWFTLEQGGTQIGENAIVSFEGTQDLYAHWAVIKYTILLDANGGSFDSSLMETISLEYGQALEGRFEEPKFVQRKFLGWQDEEGNAISVTDPIYKDMHLYAIWEIKDSVKPPKANYEDGAELEAGTKVLLSTETNNAVIKYSLNEGEYLECLDAIVINSATILKAYAVKEGFKDSDVITYSYTIKDRSDNPGEVAREDIPNNDISAIPTGFWTADIADQIFTGKAITPEVRVYWGKKLLTNKTDYTVAFKNNTNVGTATVTVSGKGNYSGSTVTTFEIKPTSIQKELDALTDLYVVYNANKAQSPSYKITFNGKKLSCDKDFTVSWTNERGEANKGCTAAGAYSVTIAGKGNYSGSVTRDFIIDNTGKILLSSAKITKIPNQNYEAWYDAETETMVSKPVLEVKMGKETLIEYVDYTVEYSNNTNIGTATATIVGNGTKYVGTKSITFKIVGTNIKSFKIEGIDRNGYFYTGSNIDPAVVVAKTVTNKDKTTTRTTLEKDKDYILTFTNDIKAGLATVTATGTGAYFGSIKSTYKIMPYDMAIDPDSKITVAYDASVPYAKGGVTPAVTVKFGEKTLAAGIDYTI
ncbi:MAG: leucine-rich repeat protein, partial [Acetatifactor sp.]|nr:leucine-rich repeat protein [Acetatifactor sp.]